ncbi:tetraspanin-31 isoform X2 [Strongylocentrotus purpuratus]|uniref:Tetraspanin-31 n=1 Tax=Strongylocentrotus purpuratus TaxID=7668 RepID=A0A7M7PTU9_STRPU|nr:tetraspanin-31 isoform X2 [Strongylocentrotus purpuratus]
MVCGGFSCSRNALIALNSLYIIVALILIIVPSLAKSGSYVSSLYIIGGIIACGIFLFIVAVAGLIGAIKHHQVCLFFYMLVLFLVFLIQFSVSIAALACGKDQREKLVRLSWEHSSNETKTDIQNGLCCCGFDKNDTSHPTCPTVRNDVKCGDQTCQDKMDEGYAQGLKISGAVGLFFSLTEFVGVFVTYRYRNLKDPRANPNAFL